MSDVSVALTKWQFDSLQRISTSLSSVTSTENVGQPVVERVTGKSNAVESTVHVHLRPELKSDDCPPIKTSVRLDLSVSIEKVSLQLSESNVGSGCTASGSGIARFGFSGSSLRLKTLSSGGLEAQFVVHCFSMTSTRPGETKFREIVPITTHGRDQLMVLYSSDSSNGTSMLVVTLDSPTVTFSIGPVFALLSFFSTTVAPKQSPSQEKSLEPDRTSQLNARFDLHNLSVSILDDDTDSATQAIQVTMKQLSLTQQVDRTFQCSPKLNHV